MNRAFDIVAGAPWAIYEPALRTVLEIAARGAVSPAPLAEWKDRMRPEALAVRGGKPLWRRVRADGSVDESHTVVRDGVAVLPIAGPTFRLSNLMTDVSGATSLQAMAIELQAAVESADVKAILLDIDSPGGTVAGTQEFANMVRVAAEQKPVIAYIGGMAASAGYWIAAAAPRVVVGPTALLGSIGVVATAHVQEAPDRDGMREVEIVSSQSPDKRPDAATEAGRATLQTLTDRLAVDFIAAVAAFRGVSAEKVMADFGKGALKVGPDAVAAGMADAVGTFEQVLAELAGARSPGNRQPSAAPAASHEETTMKTIEELKAAHPELAQALAAEATAAGATAERERILGIEKAALPGHDALVAAFKADGKTSPGDAALAIAEAERARQSETLKRIKADAQPLESAAPSAPGPAQGPVVDASAPIEDRAKAEWDKSATLRAEFGQDFSRYLAFKKAEARGVIRVLANKSAA